MRNVKCTGFIPCRSWSATQKHFEDKWWICWGSNALLRLRSSEMWRRLLGEFLPRVWWQCSSGCWWLLVTIYQTSQRIVAQAAALTLTALNSNFTKTTGTCKNLRNDWWWNQRVWSRGRVVGMSKRRNKYKILVQGSQWQRPIMRGETELTGTRC